MKIIAYIHGTDAELSKNELLAVLSMFSKGFDIIEVAEQTVVIDAIEPSIDKIKSRLALTHSIHEFISKQHLSSVETYLEKNGVEVTMPFRTRVHFTGGNTVFVESELESEYAGYIWRYAESKGIKPSVDMKNPKTIINFFIEGDVVFIGKKLFDIDKKQFIETEPANRPFTVPITMGSKAARLMVNLSRVKKGKVIDPFCGTGAILIEAGRVGLEVYGLDIKKELIKGAKRNLAHFGIKDDNLRIGDAMRIDDTFKNIEFDAVITDPPYGISASMGKVDPVKLYRESILSIEKILKPGGFAVIASRKLINLKTNMLLIGIYKERLSTNLVRHMHVFRKVK